MAQKPPRYVLTIDDHPQCAIARDAESQRALFKLIEQRTGIDRIAAERLLDTGKMIWNSGATLIVVREDVLESSRTLASTEPRRSARSKP